MNAAYVDTSVLAAIAFDERDAVALAGQLAGFDRLLSSNLLEAELRAAFVREGVEFQKSMVGGIEWILPQRSLAAEFTTVLEIGYLRGADLWHVATALYLAPNPGELMFLTLDDRQGAVATALGFAIPEGLYSP